jgi:hypothetical protein
MEVQAGDWFACTSSMQTNSEEVYQASRRTFLMLARCVASIPEKRKRCQEKLVNLRLWKYHGKQLIVEGKLQSYDHA